MGFRSGFFFQNFPLRGWHIYMIPFFFLGADLVRSNYFALHSGLGRYTCMLPGSGHSLLFFFFVWVIYMHGCRCLGLFLVDGGDRYSLWG